MTRSILILTLVVLSTVYAAPLECVEERTTGLMNECYTTFANAYGVPSPVTPLAGFFTDASFHAKRTALLEKDGIAAKPDMKDYGVGLTTCLSTVANCIEDATYELPAVGVVTPGDGHRYNTDRLITAYQTSDRGYEIQMRHFYALRACADTQGAALDQCDAVLEASPKACKDYSDNMQCYKNIFTTCCGPECGEFQCNSVGAEYTIFMKTALADGTCTFANCT